MFQIIKHQDTTALTALCWDGEKPKVVPAKELLQFGQEQIKQFCLEKGIYTYPTKELIEFLGNEMVGTTIEIGCGYGTIGRSLGIPFTDAKVQDIKEVRDFYLQNGQPIIAYPKDVEKLDAEQALKKYQPQTVIGAYITHKYNGSSGSVYGVVEGKIVNSCKYINIGNDNVHNDKPILKKPYKEYRFEWLVTRSEYKNNHVRIWQNIAK